MQSAKSLCTKGGICIHITSKLRQLKIEFDRKVRMNITENDVRKLFQLGIRHIPIYACPRRLDCFIVVIKKRAESLFELAYLEVAKRPELDRHLRYAGLKH